jgi:uncharacterized protein (DUF305 family)
MKIHTLVLASSALAASLLLAGCSNSTSGMIMGDSSSPAASGSSSGSFNDPDVIFTAGMVAHHTQAISMADMVLGKEGVDTRVTALAQKIKTAQTPEIQTMNGWLDAWGANPMTGMAGMGQTMSADDMAALDAASGADASRLFLEQMITHHQGAIDMAQVEIGAGANPDAISLAKRIISDQTAEIAVMRDLLASL